MYADLIILAERKGWFDKYGEYGLKEGIPGSNGSMHNVVMKIV